MAINEDSTASIARPGPPSATDPTHPRSTTHGTPPGTDWYTYPDFAAQTQYHLDSLQPGGCVGVLAVDIDHFEALTSLHGGAIGLEILEATASRLREAVRPHDLIARVDGNGFALVWHQNLQNDAPANIGTRVSQRFQEPLSTSAGELAITVTIGVAAATHADAQSAQPQTLLAQARAAALASRQQGRAHVTEFDPGMLEAAIQTYTTECQLRKALSNEQLSVAYQPIINLKSGRVVAVEALARWFDELVGQVSPARFIPIAEDAGMINDLGRLILRSAINQSANWAESANQPERSGTNRSGPAPVVTVNLSNRQLLDPSLIDMVKQLVTHAGLRPNRLCLEITESVVMSNVAASMTILCQLKDLGVVLAIDDFGTGYSSLSYLRRLPVDILKIDQSFIQALHRRDDRVIAEVIINLAHTLGMTTIAEGVEHPSQVKILSELNCDMAQGFLLRSPAPIEDLDLSSIDLAALAELNESLDWTSSL